MNKIKITDKQMEAHRLKQEGLSIYDIALKLGISTSAVILRLNSVERKLKREATNDR